MVKYPLVEKSGLGVVLDIGDLNAKYLSAKGLALVSEFALFLYRLNGTVINVDSRDVLQNIDRHAVKTNDPHLRKVYISLRAEIRRNILTSVPSESAEAMQMITNKNKPMPLKSA